MWSRRYFAYATRGWQVRQFRPSPAFRRGTRAFSVGADPSVQSVCDTLKQTLPTTQFQMAYGSAVYRQAGYAAADKPMVDFIVAVDDPKSWHEENLAKNPGHYSFLRYFGASSIAKIQDTAAGIYFHPYIKLHDPSHGAEKPDSVSVKYGVISVSALKEDLLNWTSLYSAGRLHKVRQFCSCIAVPKWKSHWVVLSR